MDVASYILGGLASIAAAFAAYYTQRYRSSGRVSRSDADVIFQATEELRHDLADQLEIARRERDECWERERSRYPRPEPGA